MSATQAMALPPAVWMSRTASCTVPGSLGWGLSVLPRTATLAPSRAARRAIARPMPRVAPVMNRVFPARDMGWPKPIGLGTSEVGWLPIFSHVSHAFHFLPYRRLGPLLDAHRTERVRPGARPEAGCSQHGASGSVDGARGCARRSNAVQEVALRNADGHGAGRVRSGTPALCRRRLRRRRIEVPARLRNVERSALAL